MSEKLDRVAEALYESYREDIGRHAGDEPWETLPRFKKDIARNQALAAIEAMQTEGAA